MLPSRRLLGAPGGAGAAHIIQFRPVGIESPGDELAPEGTDFSERVGAVAAACRGGKGSRSDACHDEALLFFAGGFCRAERPFEAPKASFGLIY
jgi:hypothetical protein